MSNDIKSILLINEYLTVYELSNNEIKYEDNLPRKYLKYKIQKALINSQKVEKTSSFSNFRRVFLTLFF